MLTKVWAQPGDRRNENAGRGDAYAGHGTVGGLQVPVLKRPVLKDSGKGRGRKPLRSERCIWTLTISGCETLSELPGSESRFSLCRGHQGYLPAGSPGQRATPGDLDRDGGHRELIQAFWSRELSQNRVLSKAGCSAPPPRTWARLLASSRAELKAHHALPISPRGHQGIMAGEQGCRGG